jgi:hypothetical protein
MAITYKETADLMQDAEFSGRTQVACLHFASYIYGEAASVAAHVTRMAWAEKTFSDPLAASQAIMPILVMDPKVQTAGTAITDPDLQSAVETSINKTF